MMAPARDRMPGSVRLLTLNLWGTNGPVERRMADLVSYLDVIRPDVVALQEVRPLRGRPQCVPLAEAAGFTHVRFTRSWRRDGDEEGLAVLTRWPMEPLKPVALPGENVDMPRQLQRVVVDLPPGPLLVANTHLTWRRRHGGVRLEQARTIRHVLASDPGPKVLLGDLNATRRSRALRALVAPFPPDSALTDVFDVTGEDAPATFAFGNPFARQPWLLGRRVDHVLVGEDLEVVDARVVLTGLDHRVVSDHYGVLADVLVQEAVTEDDGPMIA
ncbi:endonuclease/exonuclease/phosphatase family protein [Egicoccus sp. AB-alg2]|uniref:endonuclease/exonuclease/phosphatase family protein n=1 Tax=Egicoccus sp. AB-alg2 TaxID=3242693 RepID=UPI00359ECFBC